MIFVSHLEVFEGGEDLFLGGLVHLLEAHVRRDGIVVDEDQHAARLLDVHRQVQPDFAQTHPREN